MEWPTSDPTSLASLHLLDVSLEIRLDSLKHLYHSAEDGGLVLGKVARVVNSLDMEQNLLHLVLQLILGTDLVQSSRD